ncbi:hypothetical protein CK203_109952 [Vitis vinifera]|uniref:Uncharacterized protein n=1 Tax=Vitis vinifera TaxID=29760 RepID=A0A438CD10_VITVI|nr:hypothetical protein CK203_109952 [Vitis vinifera]
MHLETEPATASTATSQAYKNGEPGLHSFQSDPIHHNELMHYEGSGYGHNPVLYRPVSVFPHPAGYTSSMPQFYTSRGMANATTVMPDQAQFNLIQRQLLYGNPISIGHNLPVVYHSQGQSIGVPAGYNLIPNAVQTGNLYHQEQLFGSLHPWNTNYRFPGHGVVHNAASSHQNLVGVSLNSSYVHGWPGMNINPGMMHGTNPRANSTPSNLPVLQCHSRQHFPVPVGRALGLEYHLGARLNEDSNRCIQDPTTGSRPLSHSHGGLSPMDLARFSRVGLTNTSLSRIPNEQNSLNYNMLMRISSECCQLNLLQFCLQFGPDKAPIWKIHQVRSVNFGPTFPNAHCHKHCFIGIFDVDLPDNSFTQGNFDHSMSGRITMDAPIAQHLLLLL